MAERAVTGMLSVQDVRDRVGYRGVRVRRRHGRVAGRGDHVHYRYGGGLYTTPAHAALHAHAAGGSVVPAGVISRDHVHRTRHKEVLR